MGHRSLPSHGWATRFGKKGTGPSPSLNLIPLGLCLCRVETVRASEPRRYPHVGTPPKGGPTRSDPFVVSPPGDSWYWTESPLEDKGPATGSSFGVSPLQDSDGHCGLYGVLESGRPGTQVPVRARTRGGPWTRFGE